MLPWCSLNLHYFFDTPVVKHKCIYLADELDRREQIDVAGVIHIFRKQEVAWQSLSAKCLLSEEY